MSIEKRLRLARKAIGLTQKDAAKLIGLNPANFRDLESGKVKISTLHALALEYILKINSVWLQNGEGEMILEQSALPETSPPGHSDSVSLHKFDSKLLSEIISGVEEWLYQRDLELDPKSKGELISLLYEQFLSENNRFNEGTLDRFMRLGTK